MVENRYGRIINIASIYDRLVTLLWIQLHTILQRAALLISQSGCAELAKYNITCNTISPDILKPTNSRYPKY